MNRNPTVEKKKIGRMNEAAWVIGIVVCALGVALCTKADFGLSMIAAPPFIFHYALRGAFPWFTQGTAEYVWQGVLLILMCAAVRRFRWRYLLSFGTAVIAGLSIADELLTAQDDNTRLRRELLEARQALKQKQETNHADKPTA